MKDKEKDRMHTKTEKKKIGMVVAVEIDAVLQHLGEPVETASFGSLPVRAKSARQPPQSFSLPCTAWTSF